MTTKQIRKAKLDWRRLQLEIIARVTSGTPTRISRPFPWNDTTCMAVDFRTEDAYFVRRRPDATPNQFLRLIL